MKSIIAIVISTISSFSVICQAKEGPLESRFRAAAIAGFQEAIDQGFTEIDGIVLQEAIAAAKRIHITYNPRFQVVFGGRSCAVWFREGFAKTLSGETVWEPSYIRISPACSLLDDEELKGVAMHEVSGVNFVADLNYGMSAPARAKSKIQLRLKENTLKFIDKDNLQIIKQDLRKSLRDGGATDGGATGFGGGGDARELKFKVAGLKVLDNLAEKSSRVYGIPVELLHEALLRTEISAAWDIDHVLVFLGPRPVAKHSRFFIYPGIYDIKDEYVMGIFALEIARLQVLYAASELGAKKGELNSDGAEVFEFSALKVPFFYLPIGQSSYVVWRNSKLIANTSAENLEKLKKEEENFLKSTREGPEFHQTLDRQKRLYKLQF